MPVLTVKVEEYLRHAAAVVLDELGLDMPTAIRMYLKSVVRENGLPICTRLSEAPAAALGGREEDSAPAPVGKTVSAEELFEEAAEDEEEPAETAAEPIAVEEASSEPIIDYSTRSGRKAIAALFIEEICAVPAGSLTRWKDMEAKLSARYGTEVTRPQSIRWPATTTNVYGIELEIPYWRVVGDRGAVRGDKMIEQSVQEEKLKAEGHAFVSAGHGTFTGIKVEGWKKKLV